MRPVLWHIEISHFSEKARWALQVRASSTSVVRRRPACTFRSRCGFSGSAVVPYARLLATGTSLRYGAGSERAAQQAKSRVLAILDRLEMELGDREYLVGDRFSVADLTAASLLYPLVLPEQAPKQVQQMPERYERLRASLKGRRGYRWVQEIYAAHRSIEA